MMALEWRRDDGSSWAMAGHLSAVVWRAPLGSGWHVSVSGPWWINGELPTREAAERVAAAHMRAAIEADEEGSDE